MHALAGPVNSLFDLLILILILRIVLSWFPNVDWYKQPFKLLNDIATPILEPFRRIIPPIGFIDISPVVAFLAINILQNIVVGLLLSL